MEVMCNNYMPGDTRLVEKLVSELKSQGIFDQFRKECISDVDTKPAYQNLRQRVEGTVTTFLKQQTWSVDLNKNQLREQVRKNLHESGFLETGVERIVDQVVNPKINTVFLPKVEDVVYGFLGIEKPVRDVKIEEKKISITDLLPTDLEAVSPESVHSFKSEKKDDSINDSLQTSSKMEEDESPPFEPLDTQNDGNFTPIDDNKMGTDENSRDSHLSGFSGLQSHDSDTKVYQMELSNQDSLNSSETHLSIVTSIVTSEDTTKMEICEDSSAETKMKEKSGKDKPHEGDEVDMQAEKENDNEELAKTEEAIVENHESEKHDEARKRDRKQDKNDEKKSKSDKDKSSSRDRKEDKTRKSSSSSKERDKSSSKHSSQREQPKEESRKDSKSSSSSRDKDKREKADKEKDKSSKNKDKLERDKSKSEKDKRVEKTKSDKESENKIEKDKNKDKSKSDKDKSKSDKDRSNRDKDKYKSDKDRDKNSKEKYKEKEKSSKNKEKSDGDKSSKEKSSKEKDKELKDRNKENERESKDKKESNSSKHTSGRDKKKDSSSSHSNKDRSSSSNNKDTAKHATGDSKSKSSDKSRKDEDKHHSSSKKDKPRDTKKKSKDDHYSSKIKKSDRRSTDRDSNDGKQNYLGSYSESASSKSENTSQDNSNSSFSGGSRDSGNSDQQERILNKENDSEVIVPMTHSNAQALKYIKPKFASNFQEARKIMKIRKQLAKLERQNQLSLAQMELPKENGTASEAEQNSIKKIVENNEEMDSSEEKENINISETVCIPNELTLERTDLSREKFEALEAKLAQVMATADYNSYESDDDYEFHGYSSADALHEQITEVKLDVVKKTILNHQSETIGSENNGKKLNNMRELSVILDKTTDMSYVDCCRFLEKPSPSEVKNLRYIQEFIEQLRREVKETVGNSQNRCWTLNKTRKRKLDDNADRKNNNNSSYFGTDITTEERFSLPLSPAESDKSNDRKEEDLLIPTKQKRIIRGYSQRYSSDDLYKPRPVIGRRNRFPKNTG